MKKIYGILATIMLIPLLLTAQRAKKAPDELTYFGLKRASQAVAVNADNAFLVKQGARGSYGDSVIYYRSLRRGEYNRKLRYNELQRQQESLALRIEDCEEFRQKGGYEGIIKNYDHYDGYTFEICPENGGQKKTLRVGPQQSAKTTLIPGRYVGRVYYGGRFIGYHTFDVPNRVSVDGEDAAWALVKERW